MNLSELPGAEFILPGIDDLHKGQNQTIGSLLIAMAATRLSSAGLDFPLDNLAPEPELTLYAQLLDERDDAYPYYNALLSRLISFCNALELINKDKLLIPILYEAALNKPEFDVSSDLAPTPYCEK